MHDTSSSEPCGDSTAPPAATHAANPPSRISDRARGKALRAGLPEPELLRQLDGSRVGAVAPHQDERRHRGASLPSRRVQRRRRDRHAPRERAAASLVRRAGIDDHQRLGSEAPREIARPDEGRAVLLRPLAVSADVEASVPVAEAEGGPQRLHARGVLTRGAVQDEGSLPVGREGRGEARPPVRRRDRAREVAPLERRGAPQVHEGRPSRRVLPRREEREDLAGSHAELRRGRDAGEQLEARREADPSRFPDGREPDPITAPELLRARDPRERRAPLERDDLGALPGANEHEPAARRHDEVGLDALCGLDRRGEDRADPGDEERDASQHQ